jgi:ABC-type sulfate transport system permease component
MEMHNITKSTTGRGVVLAIFYVFYPIFLRSSRETFVSRGDGMTAFTQRYLSEFSTN